MLSTKPEERNISLCHWRKTERYASGQKCKHTDRPIGRYVHHNTPLPSWGGQKVIRESKKYFKLRDVSDKILRNVCHKA